MGFDIADKHLKGLASSGSWLLFDKIDQLETSRNKKRTKKMIELSNPCFRSIFFDKKIIRVFIRVRKNNCQNFSNFDR